MTNSLDYVLLRTRTKKIGEHVSSVLVRLPGTFFCDLHDIITLITYKML